MGRFKKTQINWKYIIGEVLLIFIGISLAIWFNNWNSSRRTASEKKIAIEKIEGEILNNLDDLIKAREGNSKIKTAMDIYNSFHLNEVGTVATPSQMREFRMKYPRFFRVEDSTAYRKDQWIYEGDTYINLELTELTQIAWETSKVTGITSAFGYECLYILEGMYNMQKLVQEEMVKAAEALQERNVDRLLRILQFIDQYDSQLEADYRRALETIKTCK